MEIKEAIRTRRSIRRYLKKPVDDKLIAEILDTARFTPSSGNIQNWRFIVVKDTEKIKELTIAALNQSWMNQAPVHIIVCNDLTNIKRLYKERGEKLYSIQNCAAAVQNILLAAYSLGIGSCWVGAFDKEGVKRILKIPDGIEPEAIITLGYSFDKIFQIPHRHELHELTFFEEWGNKEKDFGISPASKHTVKIEEQTKSFFSKIKEKISSLKEKSKNSNDTSNN
jgi:nitroreductase